jgi:hypothetical protein
MFINDKELNQEILCEEAPNLCEKFTNYLMNCILCFQRDEDQDCNNKIMAKFGGFIDKKNQDSILIDKVKIGSKREIEDYEIEWKRLSEITGQKMNLFDSFRPMNIC